jgi:hypothetical protein
MRDDNTEELMRKLKSALKNNPGAVNILKRYWQDKIAIIWKTEDVHRAANECEVALTEREAMTVLETLHLQHNPQLGLRWEDLTAHIKENVLGRKLNKREVHKFVHRDKLTIQR